jgi:murein DD-endopeptidase MepM/ murein hydrolase activator NlpD
VGTTGGVADPQLHFETRRGSDAVNPDEVLGPATASRGDRDDSQQNRLHAGRNVD